MIHPDDFKKWRSNLSSTRGRHYVSKTEAAERLGVSYSSYKRYEELGCESRTVALAMSAVAFNLPPYVTNPD